MEQGHGKETGTGSAVLQSKPWDAAVQMDMEHRLWSAAIQTLEKQPLGSCAYVLLLSHFTKVQAVPGGTMNILQCYEEELA